MPFLGYPKEIRKILYTTNIIESLNAPATQGATAQRPLPQRLRRALARVRIRALHPLTQRGLGQIQLVGHLRDAPVASPAKAYRFGLELRGE